MALGVVLWHALSSSISPPAPTQRELVTTLEALPLTAIGKGSSPLLTE
jgi:hypothetical protein